MGHCSFAHPSNNATAAQEGLLQEKIKSLTSQDPKVNTCSESSDEMSPERFENFLLFHDMGLSRPHAPHKETEAHSASPASAGSKHSSTPTSSAAGSRQLTEHSLPRSNMVARGGGVVLAADETGALSGSAGSKHSSTPTSSAACSRQPTEQSLPSSSSVAQQAPVAARPWSRSCTCGALEGSRCTCCSEVTSHASPTQRIPSDGGKETRRQKLKEVFNVFDLENSGIVPARDLVVLAKRARGQWTEEQNTQLLSVWNHEGHIAAAEFCESFEQALPRAALVFDDTIEQFMEIAKACRQRKTREQAERRQVRKQVQREFAEKQQAAKRWRTPKLGRGVMPMRLRQPADEDYRCLSHPITGELITDSPPPSPLQVSLDADICRVEQMLRFAEEPEVYEVVDYRREYQSEDGWDGGSF